MPAPRKPSSRRNTPTPTLPVATRVGIPMLRAAYSEPTAADEVHTVGHCALPIMELRPDLSHGGHRYQRWLISKANRAHIAALFASSVSDHDRLVPAPSSHDILTAAAAAVRSAS